MQTHTLQLSRPKLISVTVVTIVLSFALPFVFHALPQSGIPLGARFLPIFYAPLLAAALFPAFVALLAGLLAPLLNHLLLGNPPMPMVVKLSAELVIFSTLILLLKKYLPLWLLAPLAYLVAKTAVFFAMAPAALTQGAGWSALAGSLTVALPGIVLLGVLGGVASSWYKGER
jgi:hypothetical protein